MTSLAATEAWAIKSPDGNLDLNYIHRKKSALIDRIGENVYNCAIDEGYRCVRVRVEEIVE